MTSVHGAHDGREWILDAYRALEPKVGCTHQMTHLLSHHLIKKYSTLTTNTFKTPTHNFCIV